MLKKTIAITTIALFQTYIPVPATSLAQNLGRSFQPLSANTCNQIRGQMEKALKAKVTLKTASFNDYINGGQGTGCLLIARGNERNFRSVEDVTRKLRTILTNQGWLEDGRYVADGPTGAGLGFRKGRGLSLLSVEWEPSSKKLCPEDQPISDCQLSPEQKIYRITLNSARR
jgi:hypothetical protein